MTGWDIAIIIAIIIAMIGVALYFLNKWSGRRMAEQQDMVQKHKQTVTIYVIDKKKDKITNANFPKAMLEQVGRMGKMMKMPIVKAKIGPQIMTLVCDKAVFEALPVKKTVTVEMAGAYIIGMKGLKTKHEMAEARASRRREAPSEEKSALEKLKSRFRR